MKAARVTALGGLGGLVVDEVPAPRPGPDEVLVQVHACGLNFSDVLQRSGTYVGGPRPPFVSGSEASGVIQGTSERVALVVETGAHAELVAVPRARCIPIPDSMSFEAAAALPVSYLTAYHALVTCARAQPGESVVILAAGGSLGTAAIQIARCLGLHVWAIASTPQNRALARELGAHTALAYDQLGDLRADLVIDGVGGRTTQRILRRMRPFGRLVLVGCASGDVRPLDPIALIHQHLSVLGLHLGVMLECPHLIRDATERLLVWIEKGEIRVQVGEVLPLSRIREAHTRMADRAHSGKIVLCP